MELRQTVMNTALCRDQTVRLNRLCRTVNGFPDSWIGPTATDIRNAAINRFIVGLRVVPKQRNRTHDHTRLTISALGHLLIDPGLLHRMQIAVFVQALDRHNRLAGHGRYR